VDIVDHSGGGMRQGLVEMDDLKRRVGCIHVLHLPLLCLVHELAIYFFHDGVFRVVLYSGDSELSLNNKGLKKRLNDCNILEHRLHTW